MCLIFISSKASVMFLPAVIYRRDYSVARFSPESLGKVAEDTASHMLRDCARWQRDVKKYSPKGQTRIRLTQNQTQRQRFTRKHETWNEPLQSTEMVERKKNCKAVKLHRLWSQTKDNAQRGKNSRRIQLLSKSVVCSGPDWGGKMTFVGSISCFMGWDGSHLGWLQTIRVYNNKD